jgi:cytoskeletal protein RodZ
MPRDDREQNFEKALTRNLQSSFAASNPSAPSADCLDAEVLAAFHDRLLDPEEMASRKQHIAVCRRCQEILVQLEATDEIPVEADRDLLLDAGAITVGTLEPASEGLHVPATSAAASAGAAVAPVPVAEPDAAKKGPITITTLKHPPSLERPKMVRWVALVGALAAGLLFWIAFRERAPKSFELAKNQQQRSVPDAQLQPPSTASAPAAAPSTADSLSQPSQQSQRAQPSQKSESSRAEALSSPPLPKSNSTEISRAVAGRSGAPVLQKKETAPEELLKQLQAPALVTNQKPASVVEDSAIAMAAKRPPEGLAADLKRQLDLRSATPKAASGNAPPSNPGEVLPATPPPARAKVVPDYTRDSAAAEPQGALTEVANVSAPPTAAQLSVSGRALSSLAPLSVPAPGGTTLWRIGQAGMIQRSSDSGATWSIQPSGVVADLIAGSAYNDQVCWLVGRAGTILRTIDGGATWQKITAPTSVDLVSVFAINAQSATITDDAAHSYQTSSAGARWSRTLLSPHQ